MHQADQQRAPPKSVRVRVFATCMRDAIRDMAVKVQMVGVVAVSMPVKVDAVAPKSPQQMRAQPDQHDTYGGFERLRYMLRDCVAQQDRCAGEDKQGKRVAQSPS